MHERLTQTLSIESTIVFNLTIALSLDFRSMPFLFGILNSAKLARTKYYNRVVVAVDEKR